MLSKKIKSTFLRKKYDVLIFISIFILTSCLRGEDKKITSHNPQVVFSISAASDTIVLGEYAKIFAKLKTPYFTNADSEIMVFIEKSDIIPLEPDLSNQYDMDMTIFMNLKHDTLNQKWIRNVDYDKTVVFGKKFSKIGKKTIRGYIMEYLGGIPPIDYGALDSVPVKKYYFKEEIFVIPSPQAQE